MHSPGWALYDMMSGMRGVWRTGRETTESLCWLCVYLFLWPAGPCLGLLMINSFLCSVPPFLSYNRATPPFARTCRREEIGDILSTSEFRVYPTHDLRDALSE